MTRTDYLVSRWERLLGVAPPTVVPQTLRGPLIAFIASLGLIASLGIVQAVRLDYARHDVDIATQRLARDEAALRQLDAVELEIRQLRALDREIDRISQTGVHGTSAVAAIGNQIPHDAWLSSIRRERDGYVLEGGARHVSTVSRTLAALAALHGTGPARLVSLAEAPAGRGFRYAITLGASR
jgi:Tfp pilus assembly protein PilN